MSAKSLPPPLHPLFLPHRPLWPHRKKVNVKVTCQIVSTAKREPGRSRGEDPVDRPNGNAGLCFLLDVPLFLVQFQMRPFGPTGDAIHPLTSTPQYESS